MKATPASAETNTLQPKEVGNGWILLFDGKTQFGWAPRGDARWTVANGTLVLAEETGHRADRWLRLARFFTTPGFCDEKIWLYAARGLEPATQDLDRDEVLTVRTVPFAEAVEKARRGEIHDGKTVCALLRAAHRFGG